MRSNQDQTGEVLAEAGGVVLGPGGEGYVV